MFALLSSLNSSMVRYGKAGNKIIKVLGTGLCIAGVVDSVHYNKWCPGGKWKNELLSSGVQVVDSEISVLLASKYS